MFEGLFQPMHLLVIFGIALLVFGPKKLPGVGKGVGEGIRGFKAAMKADEENPVSKHIQGVNRGFGHRNPLHTCDRIAGIGSKAAAYIVGTRGAS
jgi:sec-independent protein translocase protein TatA